MLVSVWALAWRHLWVEWEVTKWWLGCLSSCHDLQNPSGYRGLWNLVDFTLIPGAPPSFTAFKVVIGWPVSWFWHSSLFHNVNNQPPKFSSGTAFLQKKELFIPRLLCWAMSLFYRLFCSEFWKYAKVIWESIAGYRSIARISCQRHLLIPSLWS